MSTKSKSIQKKNILKPLALAVARKTNTLVFLMFSDDGAEVMLESSLN